MNQNFTIKAYKPLKNATVECRVYSCRSYRFEWCTNDGIILTACGLSGTDEDVIFMIPPSSAAPTENDFTKIIVENMAGKTVDYHKYKGDKLVTFTTST
jgi:hypothetical protein